jgi:hypothetical protein
MSELLIGTNPEKPAVVGSINLSATNEEKATQLPKPSGYRILCAIPEIEKEYDSGIVKADSTMHYEAVLTTVLFVVELGRTATKTRPDSRLAHGVSKATLY